MIEFLNLEITRRMDGHHFGQYLFKCSFRITVKGVSHVVYAADYVDDDYYLKNQDEVIKDHKRSGWFAAVRKLLEIEMPPIPKEYEFMSREDYEEFAERLDPAERRRIEERVDSPESNDLLEQPREATTRERVCTEGGEASLGAASPVQST